MSDYSQILICIPTYNEAENIGTMIGRVRDAVPGASILVVDDSSPDGTGELVDEMAAGIDELRVLHRPAKSGLATAYLEGFQLGLAAGYRFLVEMDADGSHDPTHLVAMMALVDDPSTGLVIGSRYVAGGGTRGWPRSRRLLSRAGNAYVRIMMGIPVHDATAGFRVYRAATLTGIDLSQVQSRGYSFQIEMAWRVHEIGWRIAESPILFTDRAAGTSKMSRAVILEALWRTTCWSLARTKNHRSAELQAPVLPSDDGRQCLATQNKTSMIR